MLNQRQQDGKCGTSQSFKNLLLKNKHVHTPNHKHTNVTMGMPKALSCRAWLFLSQHGTGIHRLDTYTHAKSSLTQSTVICFQAYSHTPVHSNIYTHPHVRLQYACKSLPTEFSCFFPSTVHAYTSRLVCTCSRICCAARMPNVLMQSALVSFSSWRMYIDLNTNSHVKNALTQSTVISFSAWHIYIDSNMHSHAKSSLKQSTVVSFSARNMAYIDPNMYNMYMC
jgi:hypothetical protein